VVIDFTEEQAALWAVGAAQHRQACRLLAEGGGARTAEAPALYSGTTDSASTSQPASRSTNPLVLHLEAALQQQDPAFAASVQKGIEASLAQHAATYAGQSEDDEMDAYDPGDG
jgi:hypothetical protein